jgi:copper chaperone CopZ
LDETQLTDLTAQLKSIDGVADVVIIPEDEIAYLKVDLQRVDQDALDGYAVQG